MTSHTSVMIEPLVWAWIKCCTFQQNPCIPDCPLYKKINYNEDPSYVNKLLDGCTYPKWKMTHIASQKINFGQCNMQQAIIRDQWRQLALMEPHFLANIRHALEADHIRME